MQRKACLCLCIAVLLLLWGAVLGTADARAADAPPRTRNHGYIWRIDADDVAGLPRNFRTMDGDFRAAYKADMDASYVPTREGLERLHASGSGEFSASGLRALLEVLAEKTSAPICIVDLREESHGFFNGTAVSWYGERDWGNVGLTQATDHIWPEPAAVDEFVRFYKTLPDDVWLHFHCQAGEGRTTEFLAMYDILKNPTVPLKDVLYRQCLLGGSYVAHVEPAGSTYWKVPYYEEKARHIALFHRYVREQQAADFAVSWSDWLAAQADAE